MANPYPTTREQGVKNIDRIVAEAGGLTIPDLFGANFMAGVRMGVTREIAPLDTELVEQAEAATQDTGLDVRNVSAGAIIGELLGRVHNIGSVHPVHNTIPGKTPGGTE